MKVIYEIDAQAFMTYNLLEIPTDSEVPKGYIDVPLPTDDKGNQLPFWRPKWTGTEWIEDKSQEEFDEEALLNSLIPTEQEIIDAELELKIVNTLMEVEVI